MKRLRAIPAVEKVLRTLGETGLPRPMTLRLVRRELAALRTCSSIPEFDVVLAGIRDQVEALRRSRLQPLINGTGIVIHTNLGRAPLGPAAAETLRTVATLYNNLEFDLGRGTRGSRAAYVEEALAAACGAEAATVVNNCAAAYVLCVRHFVTADRPEVVVSRGELIQIGGGFRIPEILEACGARLREVGTTNRTSADDYARAMGKHTALILKVHRSNFFMDGFVESPATAALAALARRHRRPFLEGLGSGALVATEKLAGIEHEPTPAEVLRQGVDLVCFSGDKLLGGPQAGIIAGRARMVAALKREPLFRALRCDKLILAALQTTADLYLRAEGDDTSTEELPTLALLRLSNDTLRARGARIVEALAGLSLRASLGEGKAQVGGGTLPRSILPSVTVDLVPAGIPLAEWAGRLRAATPPLIGYVSGGGYKIDLRTVFPEQDEAIVRAVRRALDTPENPR